MLAVEVALVAALGLGMRRLGTQVAALLYCLFAGVNGVLFGAERGNGAAITKAKLRPRTS